MGQIKLYDAKVARQVARYLLETKAVTLRPDNPYTWSSGWRSPIYCDNRIVLSHVKERNAIRNILIALFQQSHQMQKQVKMFAGVATGGMPLSSIIADAFDRPYYFIRGENKDHGKGARVEGDTSLLNEKTPALIIEDLISTGGSSFRAGKAMQEFAPVQSMIAIFTYGFPKSEEAFADEDYDVTVLCNYPILIAVAKEINYLNAQQEELLMKWSPDPEQWSKNYKALIGEK